MTSHNSFPYPHDRYGNDVLHNNPHQPTSHPRATEVCARVGLLIEDVQSGFVGEIIDVRKVAGTWVMVLEDYHNKQRSFPLGSGYWIEGKPVTILPPHASSPLNTQRRVAGHRVTASGSLHTTHRARTARASRIWVEGKHDAELISKIWGEDLAYVGVVIEELAGVDNLEATLQEFSPTPTRRAGVLVDHYVAGSKESRIAAKFSTNPHVLILGHPYVDVWQAIKPSVLHIPAWPDVPRHEDIKIGTLKRLGWFDTLQKRAIDSLSERNVPLTPHAVTSAISGMGWSYILKQVTSYKDLEPSLLGRMEELIDFVTAGDD